MFALDAVGSPVPTGAPPSSVGVAVASPPRTAGPSRDISVYFTGSSGSSQVSAIPAT